MGTSASGEPSVPQRRGREARANAGCIMSGLGISALGLGVALAVNILGAPEAEIVAPRDSRPGIDVTRAEPLPSAPEILDEAGLTTPAPTQRLGSAASAVDLATLERFPSDSREPHPVSVEIRKGETTRQSKLRHREHTALATEVRTTARDKASRSRARAQLVSEGAVRLEHERLAEEQRQQEEAERLAREAAEQERLAEEAGETVVVGTLVDGLAPSPAPRVGGSPPVSGRYTISARWGQVGMWSRYHTGIDLAAPIGRPVLAANDGVVRAPVAGGWAGIHVIVEHPDGGATLYAHLGQATVQPGDHVQAGEVIGVIGLTGRTFGPHLHFEYYPSVRSASNPYATSDPFVWMITQGVTL